MLQLQLLRQLQTIHLLLRQLLLRLGRLPMLLQLLRLHHRLRYQPLPLTLLLRLRCQLLLRLQHHYHLLLRLLRFRRLLRLLLHHQMH